MAFLLCLQTCKLHCPFLLLTLIVMFSSPDLYNPCSTLWDWSIWLMDVNPESRPLSSFQFQTGCQVGCCLFVIHKHQTQPGNLTLLLIPATWHQMGAPFCHHNPWASLFIVAGSCWDILTYLKVFSIHNLWFSSIDCTRGISWTLPSKALCVQVSPGTVCSSPLCFHELCVLFLSPWLSQGFKTKKRRGSPWWKHSVHAKTTCWGDRSGLFFDISWSDSQLLRGCKPRTIPAWHLCCSPPWAV